MVAKIRPNPPPTPQLQPRPAPKPPPAQVAKKPGLVDRLAGQNDGSGIKANGIKSAADLYMMARGARDVRTERYQFGPWNISRENHRTVTPRNTRLTRAAAGGAGVLGALQLPTAAASAIKDIRDGFRGGWTGKERDKAIGSSASLLSVGLNTYKGFAELGKARTQLKEAKAGFRNAIERQAQRATNPAQAAEIRSKAKGTAEKMAKKFLAAPGDVRVDDLKHIADTDMRRAVSGGASKKIAQNGLKAAKLAGKTAGRFVPGANVVIAAADTAAFYSTMKDKDASVGKKVAAGITAAGSVLAATNIPIASQVGAAVSTVASVVGAIGPEKIGNGIKNVAKKLKFW